MDISILHTDKENMEGLADSLTKQDIENLIPILTEKNDDIRYRDFLLLQKRSSSSADVYPYWNVFVDKLDNENSYQRSIGIMLIAENIRWDHSKQFSAILDRYMSHCMDEKFVTSRQTIQSIIKWVQYTPELLPRVVTRLLSIDLATFKQTQQKLILTDIVAALIAIRELNPSQQIDDYLFAAMTGKRLDKKIEKQIQNLLKGC